MDKLGEYIPLIIFGLILVVSFLKKSKKKREEEYDNTTLPKSVRKDPFSTEKKPVYNESSNKPTGRNTVVREVFKQKTPSQPQTWSFDQEVISSLEISGEQNTYVNQFPEKNIEISDSDEVNLIFDKDNNQVDSPVIINPKDFNELRKAVIYSEILQRKYS